jgi:hypothetical protein
MPYSLCRLAFALPTSALLVLLVSASGQPTTQPAPKTGPTSQPTLVGIWKAEGVQTQLFGPMTITYNFGADGRVRISQAQVDGDRHTMSAAGTYSVDGEHLVIKSGAKEMKQAFKIDGDNLTIIELSPNGYTFNLKRQPSTRPATKLVARAQQATTTTAPANQLLGRWQVLSRGAKKIPAEISIFWTFDERDVVVTGNGEVGTKSQYTLRPDGEHQAIFLTPEDKDQPDRAGWYRDQGWQAAPPVDAQYECTARGME